MKKSLLKKISVGKLGVLDVDLPYLVFGKGKPRGLILGLQHGGELSSLAVINELVENKNLIQGQAVVVPVVNPFGLLFRMRNEPLENKNLNRNYPGNKKGDFAQRLTAKIFSLAKTCDFVIDLHTFTTRLTPIICGFTETDKKIKEKILKMIKSFNPDLVWQIDLKRRADKRFYGTIDKALTEINIPTIFVEMPNLAFIKEEQIKKVVKGLFNIFKDFNKRKNFPKRISVFSAKYLFADQSGLFIPRLFPKEKVRKGQTIGEVFVLPDFKKTIIKSPFSGTILTIQSKNFVRLGSKLASIGKEIDKI